MDSLLRDTGRKREKKEVDLYNADYTNVAQVYPQLLFNSLLAVVSDCVEQIPNSLLAFKQPATGFKKRKHFHRRRMHSSRSPRGFFGLGIISGLCACVTL